MSINISPANLLDSSSLIPDRASISRRTQGASPARSFYNCLAQAAASPASNVSSTYGNLSPITKTSAWPLAVGYKTIGGVESSQTEAKVELPTRPEGLVKESDWLALKPEEYSMEQFKAKIADANTRLGFLNPAQLPAFVTRPESGISRSTDMVKPPSFEECNGGVSRIDHTMSGQVRTFIPCFEWRQTASDASLGTVFNQQTPWGFRTVFIRDGSSRSPEGYRDGAYLAKIQGYITGNSGSYALRPEDKIGQITGGLTGSREDLHSETCFQLTPNWEERMVLLENEVINRLLEEKQEEGKESLPVT